MTEGALSLARQAAELAEWMASGEAHALRVRAGLSLDAVAREVDVVPSAVFRWERNERRPRGRNVRVYHAFLAELRALAASES